MYGPIAHVDAHQALAESMGIETDWNCAISLRPLEDSSQPDPHRMKSNYADWDVKVRELLTAIDPFDRVGVEASSLHVLGPEHLRMVLSM